MITEEEAAEMILGQRELVPPIIQEALDRYRRGLAKWLMHNINNQLAVILGSAEMIQFVDNDRDLKRYIKQIETACQKSSLVLTELNRANGVKTVNECGFEIVRPRTE